jgi:hypothetical protein
MFGYIELSVMGLVLFLATSAEPWRVVGLAVFAGFGLVVLARGLHLALSRRRGKSPPVA